MNALETTLGNIAATGPEARAVLLRHQLDFCCGGKQSLSAACVAAGLEPAAIIAELAQAAEGNAEFEDWSQRPLAEVIEHILSRFHRPLHGQLDAVVTAAEKIERVHGAKDTCPVGLAAHLRTVREELRSHMGKEERVLFPAILGGQRGEQLLPPVGVLTHEHDDHGEALRTMRTLATDFQPPGNACATWRTLYEMLETLEADLMEHIHLENHVLFPRAIQAG
jgi:regulator of cell morphogenesis and NO signaling